MKTGAQIKPLGPGTLDYLTFNLLFSDLKQTFKYISTQTENSFLKINLNLKSNLQENNSQMADICSLWMAFSWYVIT